MPKDEAKQIVLSARENGWIPTLALVSKDIRFFSNITKGKYTIDKDYTEI